MPRELIIIAKDESGLSLNTDGTLAAKAGVDVTPLTTCLANHAASIRRLFDDGTIGGLTEGDPSTDTSLPPPAAPNVDGADTNLGMIAEDGSDLPPLTAFFAVDAADDQLDALATELYALTDILNAAYVKPEVEPAMAPPGEDGMTPGDAAGAPAAPGTPDFRARQGYLDTAPDGIDAAYAWTKLGGNGADIRIVDVEGGWNYDHEDLQANKGGVVSGTNLSDLSWRNHGTAVLGEMGGDANAVGVTGICPNAWISSVSHSPGGSAPAILYAATQLRKGDVLLLEMHRPGPASGYANNATQSGYIAVEFWFDDYVAIRTATAKGVLVVEAAGNGAQNLDDPMYGTAPPGSGPLWRNPFSSSTASSGAVVVGAGSPPPGTHGRTWRAARARLDFSNYGWRVDCQAWGREVTSTGYGDLQGGGANDNAWYTDTFAGTSSASPIVAGALTCVDGFLKARATTGPLTPALARLWLRVTGSPQQDDPASTASAERIGNLPNLKYILDNI